MRSQFTSDRRKPSESSWTDGADWLDGTAEDVDVVDSKLVARSILDSKVVESWEDGDLSEYIGNTGSFAAQQDTTSPAEGSYALERTDAGSVNNIISQSGLPNYPASGDEFGWLVYIPSSTTPTGGGYICGTRFAEQNTSGGDANGTQHRPGENQWKVGNIGSSIANNTVSASVNYGTDVPYDTWLEERVTNYDGNQFTITLYDGPSWDGGSQVAQLTYSGTVYSGGGISFQCYGQVFWDNYVIWI